MKWKNFTNSLKNNYFIFLWRILLYHILLNISIQPFVDDRLHRYAAVGILLMEQRALLPQLCRQRRLPERQKKPDTPHFYRQVVFHSLEQAVHALSRFCADAHSAAYHRYGIKPAYQIAFVQYGDNRPVLTAQLAEQLAGYGQVYLRLFARSVADI